MTKPGRVESSGLYVLRADIAITMDKIVQAADVDVSRGLRPRFLSGSPESFKKSTCKILTFVREAAAKRDRSIQDTEGRITFVKFRYLVRG